LEETWLRVRLPILQRYLAASKKLLVAGLEKNAQALVNEWGCKNPALKWIAAVDDFWRGCLEISIPEPHRASCRGLVR
jgi:hypothetical protein